MHTTNFYYVKSIKRWLYLNIRTLADMRKTKYLFTPT